ncbi:DNA primase protein [Rhizobium phage RHph_TM16]|nr:DNA primase protein [Rhizobium phage RHph_TM16]
MKKSDVMEFLDCFGVKVPKNQPRAKWVVSQCPLQQWNHDNGKSSDEVFGVRMEQGDPFCNCFACGYHGSGADLVLKVKEFGGDPEHYNLKRAMELCVKADDEKVFEFEPIDYEEALQAGKEEVTVFDKWWIETFPFANASPLAWDYLTVERGLDPDVVDYLGIRWDPHQNRVCCPILNTKEQYVGLHGRAIYDDIDPRYRMYLYKGKNNPQYWLGENWVEPDRPLVIVEGYFDLAAVMPVYDNVASPLFANPSIEKLQRMAHVSEIVSFLDHGTGGDKGRERLDKVFGKTHVITHVKPPMHRKDPGSCNYGEIANILAPHLPI